MKWALAENQNDGEPPETLPNYGAWTELSLTSYENSSSDYGNVLHDLVGAYRLNDIKSGKAGNDWYMITNRPQTDPAFECRLPIA